MKSKVAVNNHDKKVIEVKTVNNDDEANELLANGWELLHGGTMHIDNAGYNVKQAYILCKREKS